MMTSCLHVYISIESTCHDWLNSVKWEQVTWAVMEFLGDKARKQSPNFSVQHCVPKQIHDIAVNYSRKCNKLSNLTTFAANLL